MTIEHISDTARWTAMYRALESERTDARFQDPFARRLAGERGVHLLASLPKARRWSWPMVVRTAVMDEIVTRLVAAEGVELVVNLAAGLDTRPYRLELPPQLRWVEVDLPAILAYKAEQLAAESPRCRLERVALDLTDRNERRAFFGRLGGERTLVVAEGLLVYLEAAEVQALASDLGAVPGYRWWLIDIASPRVLAFVDRTWSRSLAASGASFRFAPADGTRFFAPCGWTEREFRPMGEEAARLGRAPWWWGLTRLVSRLGPARRLEEMRRMSGVALLEKAG